MTFDRHIAYAHNVLTCITDDKPLPPDKAAYIIAKNVKNKCMVIQHPNTRNIITIQHLNCPTPFVNILVILNGESRSLNLCKDFTTFSTPDANKKYVYTNTEEEYIIQSLQGNNPLNKTQSAIHKETLDLIAKVLDIT